MSDAMLWTIIGTFVAAQIGIVAGVLYVLHARVELLLTKRLAPIERDLHDLTRDMAGVASDMTEVKNRLTAAGA